MTGFILKDCYHQLENSFYAGNMLK